jgi:hypothetical protein
MDDGQKHKSGFILNTTGFTLSYLKLLTAALAFMQDQYWSCMKGKIIGT